MNYQKFYQERFFEQIEKRNRKGTSTLHEIMEVLSIQKGAVYKRMNGDTALTVGEMTQLAHHFKISLDSVFNDKQFVSFLHPFMQTEKTTSLEFFKEFTMFMNPLKNNKGEEFTYLANELPVFYYFSHNYIFNFVIAVWNHLHWEDNELCIDESIEFKDDVQEMRSTIAKLYYEQPVTEIWNSNMLNNLYQQIIFCVTIRAFKNESFIEKLIKDIEDLIKHLREIALSGVKSKKGMQSESSELKIYLNDFGNYLNMVQYSSENGSGTFIGYDFPQFLRTYNKDFYNFSKDWLNKIKKRSVLISGEGYQYRELFFIKMENDFKYFKERIEKLMEIYYV